MGMLLVVVITSAAVPAWAFGLGLVVCVGAVIALRRVRGQK